MYAETLSCNLITIEIYRLSINADGGRGIHNLKNTLENAEFTNSWNICVQTDRQTTDDFWTIFNERRL